MESQEIVDLIGRCAREVLPGLEQHTFVRTDRLVDLGADSVERAEIVMLVTEAMVLTVPRTELFGPTNVGELADLLARKSVHV